MQKTNTLTCVKKIVTILFSALLLAILMGCSGASKELVAIGEKTESSLALTVANETGKEIESITISPAGTEAVVLEAKELGITPEQQFIVYLDSPEKNADQFEPAGDVVLKDLFDASFVFSDGSSAQVHDLGTIAEFKVLISPEGIGYIEYVVDGSVEDTLIAEKDIIAAEKAEKEAAREAKKEAEKAAKQEQEQNEAPQAESTYDYGYEDSSAEDSVAQEEDQCVDDVVLR